MRARIPRRLFFAHFSKPIGGFHRRSFKFAGPRAGRRVALISPLAPSRRTSGLFPARVTDRINYGSACGRFTGTPHVLARAQYDQGAAPPGFADERIMPRAEAQARSGDRGCRIADAATKSRSVQLPQVLTPRNNWAASLGPRIPIFRRFASWLASYGFQSIIVFRAAPLLSFRHGCTGRGRVCTRPSISMVVNGESALGQCQPTRRFPQRSLP